MIAAIIELLTSILKAIPIVSDWFKKTELEKEAADKQKVDQEHNDNQNTQRPSEDFWKDHPL